MKIGPHIICNHLQLLTTRLSWSWTLQFSQSDHHEAEENAQDQTQGLWSFSHHTSVTRFRGPLKSGTWQALSLRLLVVLAANCPPSPVEQLFHVRDFEVANPWSKISNQSVEVLLSHPESSLFGDGLSHLFPSLQITTCFLLHQQPQNTNGIFSWAYWAVAKLVQHHLWRAKRAGADAKAEHWKHTPKLQPNATKSSTSSSTRPKRGENRWNHGEHTFVM